MTRPKNVTRLPTAAKRKVRNHVAVREEGNVEFLDIVTRLDVPAERVIAGAAGANLQHVVIAGMTEDGDEFFSSTYADGADVLWVLERAKKRLFEMTGD